MTTTRRILVLITMVAGVLFASGAAAQASYTDTAKVTATPTSITTATVAAPTQVEAKAMCTTTVDPVTGAATTTVTAKIEWWHSACCSLRANLLRIRASLRLSII